MTAAGGHASCPCRSQSTSRLSDMLLMAAFGPGGLGGLDRGSAENLSAERDVAGLSLPVNHFTPTNECVSVFYWLFSTL